MLYFWELFAVEMFFSYEAPADTTISLTSHARKVKATPSAIRVATAAESEAIATLLGDSAGKKSVSADSKATSSKALESKAKPE